MEVRRIVERDLTERESETLKRFRYYFDDRAGMALIGDGAVAVFAGRDEDYGTLEEMKEAAKDKMSALLGQMPDFRALYMDDGHGLVEMSENIYAVTPEPLDEDELNDGEIPLEIALTLRGMCLEACENGEIIAIVCEREVK